MQQQPTHGTTEWMSRLLFGIMGKYNGTGRDLRAGYSQTFSVPATRKKKQLVSSQKFRSLIVIDNFSMQCSSLE